MSLSPLVQALSQIDNQYIYTIIVWLSALLIAGLAFRRFFQES